jgi:hypothetical protein
MPCRLSIKRSDERQAETFFINNLSEDMKKIVFYNYAVSYSYYNFVSIVITYSSIRRSLYFAFRLT